MILVQEDLEDSLGKGTLLPQLSNVFGYTSNGVKWVNNRLDS